MEMLIGFALPPLVDVVNKDVTNETERFIVTLATCLFCGLMISLPKLLYGSPLDVLESGAIILGEAVTMYKLYWENSFIREKVQSKLGSQG